MSQVPLERFRQNAIAQFGRDIFLTADNIEQLGGGSPKKKTVQNHKALGKLHPINPDHEPAEYTVEEIYNYFKDLGKV